MTHIKENLQEVRNRIKIAAEKSARSESDVTLIAVTKTHPAEAINEAIKYGVTDIGENKVQEIMDKYDKVDPVRWHLIGHLQTNKVKYIIDKVAMIHSLDSIYLAQEIEKQAAKRDRTVDVLCEINCGREESKSGLMPEEAEDFCLSLGDFPHLRLRGFMTMAPKCEKNEEYRKYFQETSQQCLDIWQKKLHNIGRPILSMGMSDSFEVAIEEGADIVRVGRALFAP